MTLTDAPRPDHLRHSTALHGRMLRAQDIADATDWLNTPLAGLSPVENALHCQICKEFFDTPMITSCCHTFCSKCIRFALSTDGCCPACRTQDQPSKLRNNWQIQELVSTFLDARPAILKAAHSHRDTSRRPGKRKRDTVETNHIEHEAEGRNLRSKTRRVVDVQASQTSLSDSDADGDLEDAEQSPQEATADGLVECPLGCGKRMKIEQVEPHLDRCEDERRAQEEAEARAQARWKNPKIKERLSELNYSMMKERDLTRKLKDLGIPVWGTKQVMMRRHTAWVNIWNANCDSSRPREKRELLRELDVWERTQAGSTNQDHGVMKKEFDGHSWMTKNSDDFSKLIRDARRSRSLVSPKTGDTNTSATDSKPSLSTQSAMPPAVLEQPEGVGLTAADGGLDTDDFQQHDLAGQCSRYWSAPADANVKTESLTTAFHDGSPNDLSPSIVDALDTHGHSQQSTQMSSTVK